ncbi:MAG TPA: DUF4091 domain-containing protein [Bacteroidales bacterium]|nr:DUF4091 domain-containing protein [Bacteroidales bacterium]HNR40613.1 DUF4091 domain-containing protein [Bacteroidales bacterium]HPM18290.1 DUF4091 domain-containing protein [Bacteroidales bacterium]HQG77291.1 DUF4091 domain-containing protein [Bacteroidales bacterium]
MRITSHIKSAVLYLPVQILLILLVSSCSPDPGIKRIWAVDDGEKIKKEDISNPISSEPANATWKNNTISLFAARNEIIAFQLIIQAGKAGAKQVNVSISDLKNGSSVIPGSDASPSDPFDYRGKYVELFTEHYLNMIKRSPPLWFFSETAVPSSYYTGWVPDCLIPFSAPPEKGGAPFSIEPEMNQAVWADILVPENAVAGTYSGKVTVTVSGKKYKTIPLFIKVYDFTLSDTTHLRNMFGFYPGFIAERHNVQRNSEEYFSIELKYNQLAHRHRFDLVCPVNNLNQMDNHYKRYLTGDAYTEENGYWGPGRNIGNGTFSIGYGGGFPAEYGGSVRKMNKKDWWTGSDAWESWFLKNALYVERHKYLFPDEPDFKGPAGAKGTGSMDTIRMQTGWTHTNPGPGKNIPALVTNKIIPGLKGHVDFWSISAQEWTLNLTAGMVAEERAAGRKLGIYNGFRPGMGAVVSDADAVEFRVMPWIAWKYNIDQYFYWSTTFWTNLNVFVNPLTYEDRINGDGTFLYPGRDALFPEEDRSLDGPLSSIRAKNWRRGAQDFEYLWLAREMGLEKDIEVIVNKCIPAGVWDAANLDDASWPHRGYKFEEYRKELAELIESHK